MSWPVFFASRRAFIGGRFINHACRRDFSPSQVRNVTFGFIGLGKMGYPMAKNLWAKIPEDDKLIICDTNSETTSRFLKEDKGSKIEVTDYPRELAENSDTIITCLPEPIHVNDVFHLILREGLSKRQKSQDRLFLDCSTIDPVSSREIANAVHCTESGKFVDAPMSGGEVGAQAGTLTFMLGISPNYDGLVQRADKVLRLMGNNIWHMGGQGAGVSAKLANNYILALVNIATAEALNMGIRLGLDPGELSQMISSSTGRSWSIDVNNPVPGVVESAPAEYDYEGGFNIELMMKDLRLAMEAAKHAGAPFELANKAQETYEKTKQVYGGKDLSIVYQYLAQQSR